jgi:small-conductance mechanosensitive channel
MCWCSLQPSYVNENVASAAAAAQTAAAAAAAAAAEINEAYNAFEEQRQQNATLLGQLSERDGSLAAAQQDRLKLEHQLAQMGEQVGKQCL